MIAFLKRALSWLAARPVVAALIAGGAFVLSLLARLSVTRWQRDRARREAVEGQAAVIRERQVPIREAIADAETREAQAAAEEAEALGEAEGEVERRRKAAARWEPKP